MLDDDRATEVLLLFLMMKVVVDDDDGRFGVGDVSCARRREEAGVNCVLSCFNDSYRVVVIE